MKPGMISVMMDLLKFFWPNCWFKIHQRGQKSEESILILTADGSKFTSEMAVQYRFGVVNDESDFNNLYFLVLNSPIIQQYM